MSCLHQICFIVFVIYWINITKGVPLFQGFSIKKSIDVDLKPFQFKPITFLKEKLTPFGRFGVRKGIQKRDLGTVTSPASQPPAPVYEHIEETNPVAEKKVATQTSTTQLRPGPDPVKSLSSNLIRIPLTESLRQPTEGLYTTIGRNPPVNNNTLQNPANQVLGDVYGELPPRAVAPIPAQPISVVPVQVSTTPAKPSGALDVIPLIKPPSSPPVTAAPSIPLSEIPPTDGPLVRGSKLALYLGNVFLQSLSQFLTSARLQFSQFSRQPSSSPSPPLNQG